MSEETNKQPLTPEEADKRRKEITDFYKKQIPHLKIQAQYENLMTEIEESRAKRMQAQAFLADAYMQVENAKLTPDEMSNNQKEAKENFQKEKRKLKVEKS
jgi:hypothetical protein